MLDSRRDKMLTGSVIGSAVGVGYDSRQKLWRQITGREDRPDLSDNPIVQHGVNHEPDAIHAYEAHTGDLVYYNSDDTFLVHPEHDWLGATPDAWARDYILQAKCPQRLPDAPSAHYICQMVLEAVCKEKPVMRFVAWTPYESKIWECNDVELLWEWMFPLAQEFWQYVEDDVEPKRKKKPTLPKHEWREL